ncbi:MAG: TIR domain-containing protein [Burkholderiales bacterium]|nr:TIR domain-containing protein [Burkholderiales bacterium]MDR4518649.1 TIR domain-containing protein [Nitrosomonas sp.]
MNNRNNYLPTLTIRVLWVKAPGQDSSNTTEANPDPIDTLAESVYSAFCRSIEQPLERGMGIPVFFHRTPPEPDILNQSRHTILVVLVDDRMVISPEWNEGLTALAQAVQASNQQHRIYPVSLTPNAFNFNPVITTTNFIRLHRYTESRQPEQLAQLTLTLTHELCRLLLTGPANIESINNRLSPTPVMLFLSHAKADGEGLAETLRDHIETTSAVQTFFDTNDIAPGFDFRSEIEDNIERSVLVVLLTDHYASRTWCRREVLWAKSKGCPLVVVHAVRNREERSFPYLGNTPVIRIAVQDFDANPQQNNWCAQAVALALNEMLRFCWFRAHLNDLKKIGLIPNHLEPCPSPPEMLTVMAKQTNNKTATDLHLIYPDPPLGMEERQLLTQAAPNVHFTTPTSCAGLSGKTENEALLEGLNIGISISDSPDLEALGMNNNHLDNAMIEIARHLLSQGAHLSYGGDLRPGGFTEKLLELVWTYDSQQQKQPVMPTPEEKAETASRRLTNYVAWPIHLNYSPAILAQYYLKSVFKFIDPPADLNLGTQQQKIFTPPDTSEHRYRWYRSLTAMRERMADDIKARIILGGQIRGYAGGIPGLLEEVLLTICQKQPVYLLGGMGGCARVIIDAIEGRQPNELTVDYQSESKGYMSFLNYVRHQARTEINYPAMVEELEQAGIAGLNNGLTEEENRILFTTPHVPVMVALVLKGLVICKNLKNT